MAAKVVFLNPRTCGIYKDGGTRYRTDTATGRRTEEIDNELIEHVDTYLSGDLPPGAARVKLGSIFSRQVLVPTYYDRRYLEKFAALIRQEGLDAVSLGELIDDGHLSIRGGHGSPGNDQRSGHIPYVKVSDIRGLRININPTNLVADSERSRTGVPIEAEH